MMNEMERRGVFLLSECGGGKPSLYRGIVELVSRFGFISVEEVMYGFDLPAPKAMDRLKYLTKVGLLERFPSFTNHRSFYCLTPFGARMAEDLRRPPQGVLTLRHSHDGLRDKEVFRAP